MCEKSREQYNKRGSQTYLQYVHKTNEKFRGEQLSVVRTIIFEGCLDLYHQTEEVVAGDS